MHCETFPKEKVKGEICMKICTRRIISFVAALTLLVTCLITGLVLPTAASEENLFTNGDMEQGASVAWGNSSLIQSGVGKDGSYGYYHDRTQTDEWAATGQARYKAALANKLEPATEYILSFDYKTSGKAIGQLYFDVSFGKSGATALNGGFDLPSNVTNWTTQTFKFTTPDSISANTGWEFSIRTRGGAGEVWYDNFKLIKAADAAPAKFELADPGFDGAHGWTYNSTVTGQFTAGDAVPTQTDATGNKYITIPANGKTIRSPLVPYDIAKGDWIRIEFKARKNAAGKATVAMQLQGGMYDGYAQPEWTISTSDTGVSGNGEWFTYVTYAQAQQAASGFYMVPFLLSNKTTADLTLDIDDVKLEVLPEGTDKYDFELLDGTGFANKPSALNDYGFGGLFNDGGKIVADPADANNNVMYFDGTAAKVQAYFYPVNYTYVAEGTTAKKNVRMEANAIYKLTYRQKGTGTTSPGITPSYGSQLSVTGEPGKASDEWKEITVYYKSAASVNANYGWNFIVNGEVYLDDVSLKLVEPATAIELDKTAAQVTAGQTLTLKATAKPEGAYATAITWSSSNEAIATVENGIVTGVAAGTATITATMGELTATCTVTVKAAEAPIEPVEGLIYEYDFENGATGMFAGATSAGHFEVVSNGGIDNSGALLIGYKTSDRWLKWPTTSFKPNTRYAVTFLAKGPAAWFSIYKYSGSVTSKGGSFNVYTKPYNDGWTSYRLEFITGANGFGASEQYPNNGMLFKRSAAATEGEVTYIDNFKIAEYSAEDERVIDGSFTYPAMQQFNKQLSGTKGFAVVADPDDANNKVYKIPAGSAKLGDNYMQGLFVEEGLLYKLTFKAKGAPMSIFMSSANVTGEMSGNWAHTEQSTEWKEYSYTFVATANGATGSSQQDWILNITRNMAADSDSYIDDLSIIVTEIPKATSIELNKTTSKLGVGGTEKLTVTAQPAGSQYDSLTWTSSNTAVATVIDGVVTGVGTGEATITATAMVDGQPLTATCTIKVVVKASSFEIVQDALHLAPATNSNSLFVYETIKLKTEPADADLSGLTWKSSDETVAKVENGTVQALAAGTATITVTDGTLSDTVTVTVDNMGERITGGTFENEDWKISTYWTNGIIKDGSCSLVPDPMNPDNTVMVVPAEIQAKWMWPAHVDAGVTYKLSFKAKSASGKATIHITPSYVQAGSDSGWVVRNISSDGWEEVSYIFTTVSTGLNRNYLFGFGTNTDKNVMYVDDVSLVELPAATSIALENTTIGVKESKGLTITATPAASNIGTLTWTSSDPSIISVDQSGKVTAVAGEGSVTITAKNADGSLNATCTVTIAGDYATAIGLNMSSYYAKKNSTLQLTMSTTPVNGLYKKPVWTSSDETIATVDQNGLVTIADKVGETTITVTSGTLTATCKVVVAGAASSFEFKNETIVLAPQRGSNTISKTLTIVTTPPNADPGELTWTSSNETVATIDANGKVTALAEGETTITVKNADGSISDTCVVKVSWDGERVIGGDFENDDWVGTKIWTTNLIKDGRGFVVVDPTNAENMVMALPNHDNGNLSALWLANLHVNAGKTYKLTFKVKGDGVTESQQLAAYFHPTSVSLNGWKYNSNLTGEWKEVTYIFTTNALDDGTSTALNRNYCFGFDNAKQGLVYLDDVSLVELPEATAIVLPEEDIELWPTGSLTIAAGTVPAEASAGKLTWTSSDPNVVAVDANGRLTALADSGEVTITVTTEKGLTDTVKVVINEYANLLENGDFESGDLNWPSHATIKPGVGKDGTAGMLLDNTGSGKQDFFFKGKLPMDPGTTYIVEWDYLATPSAEFRLWGGDLGLSLGASSGDGTTWKHGKKIFTTPTNMGDINSAAKKGWIFSVTSDVEGSSPAIVDNITIRLYNSGVKAESIKLTKSSMTMMPGRTANLGIMAEPADGDVNKSVWTSSDENVVTVEYGIVTAVGKGTATITATTRDGVSATCEVTVSGNPAFITNGTFDDANDTTWGTTGGTAIVPESGVLGSNAASITADGTLTYEIKNLQPETTYQLFVRYRSAAAGKLKMTLVNGDEDLLAGKTVDTGASWTKQTIEFVTGETVADTYTLTLAVASGAGPILVDNVFLTQKATLIDFVVNSLVWTDSEQVKPGTELLFAVTISNIGEDPVKAGSTITIDICMDSKPVQTIEHTFVSEFAGDSTEMIIGTVPWAAVEGDHVMSARVNSTLSVLESNVDNNNMVQTDLRVNDEILEVPELAQQAGFTTLGFSDDFNTLDTVDVGATGADGYKWYVTRPYGATTLTTADYSIENGILTMKNVIPTYNMGFSSADCKTGRGYSWNKGYLEYKLRIPRPRKNTTGEDGVPAVWSLPLDKLMSVKGSDWVEMDWMEYWGIESNRPGGYYTITLHDQGTDENDTQIWYNKNSNAYKEGLGDGEWHTMAFLWVEDLLIGYLDDEEVFRLSYDENSFSDPMQSTIVPDERGGIGAFSYMNIQELVLHLGGSKDNPMEVDYVRIWTGVDNGSFKPEIGGDDEEEGEVIVDITAEDFWNNFCTDDFGEPIMAIDEDNYLYVIMGAGYWEMISDDRKAEINALLAAMGQPTFEELMEEAAAFLEESPEAMAEAFLLTYLMDDEGNLITEVTTDNYMQVLLSAEAFLALDTEMQIAIIELMDAYGMPTYEELLMQALAIAEQEGVDIEEFPSIEDIVIPETGENTVLPIAASVVMLISAAGLWISLKRRKA